ncbi:DUF6612 family protein [Virgibacillus sp. W0181]|uniref:DUF6612 family protein n=1 Tax=Virgibacillus sp. W0181 TaxID=3391581 RepID=UPI003F45B744
MRKIAIILSLMLLAMLVACGQEDADSTENAKQEVDSTEEAAQEEPEEVTSNDGNADKEPDDVSVETVSGVEGILKQTAKAMKSVSGMVITGEQESTMDMMGMQDHETSNITGRISFDPFAQYLLMESVSEQEGASEMEMYWTNEASYFTDTDTEGWMSVSAEQAGGMMSTVAALTESQFNFFAELHDSFELKEDDAHYILTFSSSGEEYKEVMYGAIKEMAGEDAYQSLVDMITDIKGTYELKIDKKTFYVVSMQMDTEHTNNFGGAEIHSKDHTYYEYSDFNKAEEVVVPAEVTENAQDLMDMIPQVTE